MPSSRSARRSRRVVAVAMAFVVASCGGAAPSGPVAGGSTGPAGSADGPQPASADPQGVPKVVLEALADPTPTRLALVGEDLDGAIDTETGLLKAIGPEGVAWLTDQRSAVVRAVLVDAGVDLSTVGASHVSIEHTAMADGPRTAFGDAWIGASIGVPFMLGVIAQRVGQSGEFPAEPQTSHEQRTVGDLLIVADSSALFTTSLGGSGVTVDADITQTTTATDTVHGTNVGTSSHRTHIRAELQVCPDAQGVVTLKMQVDISSSTTGALGSVSFQANATGEQRGQVGDDASLQSVTDTIDMSAATTGSNGTTQTGSGRRTITTTGGRGAANRTYTGTAQTGAGTMTADDSARWQNFLQMTVLIASQQAFDKAEEQWRGGKCVRVEASHQGGPVDPDEIVGFEAWPVHQIEGTRLDKPVVATLTGAKSVLPAGQEQDPPAPITYTAPTAVGPAGTVKLMSTSNRGIGILNLQFRVAEPIVVELEIISKITVTKITGFGVANGLAKAEGRIRLENVDADEWHGEGTLISTTTSGSGSCNLVYIRGQGVYDWVVRNAVVSAVTPVEDIVVYMDNGTINESPDAFTLPICKSTTLTGTLNTWENLFFQVHNVKSGQYGQNAFEVRDWTLAATPSTWQDGGLIATAKWSGSCATFSDGRVVGCSDDTTFKLWAVVPSSP